jgi:hypothetical protein
MCSGLVITAATAWLVAASPTTVQAIATNLFLFLLRFTGNRRE